MEATATTGEDPSPNDEQKPRFKTEEGGEGAKGNDKLEIRKASLLSVEKDDPRGIKRTAEEALSSGSKSR